MLKGSQLKLAVGLREGRGAFGRAVPQVPDDTATDGRGPINPVAETAAVLLIGQQIDWQCHTTPGEHSHHALLAQGTHQMIEGHGGDVAHRRAPLQTQPTMGGQQGSAGHLRSPRAIAEDEMGQDGEYGFAPCTLEAPDGEPTQPDPDVV